MNTFLQEIKEKIIRKKAHILIASKTTPHFILGTKVKCFNHIPTLSFFFFLCNFTVCFFFFLNVMIFQVNFLNFHEHKWNKADYPDIFFFATFSNLNSCILGERCGRQRWLVGLMGPFLWFWIPGKQIAASLTVKIADGIN